MNAKQLERLLLLEQSGELTPRQRRALAGTDAAEPKRRELEALRRAAEASDAEPDPWAAVRIDARLRAFRRPASAAAWKPALALAACLLLAAGIWNFRQTSSPSVLAAAVNADVWNVRFDEDLAELESLILAISGDPLEIMEM